MHVEQVDPLGPEAAQAGLALRAAVRRGGVDCDSATCTGLETELGGEEDGGPTRRVRREPLAEEDLGVAVGRGRVPEGEAEGMGAGEEGQAGGVGSKGGG